MERRIEMPPLSGVSARRHERLGSDPPSDGPGHGRQGPGRRRSLGHRQRHDPGHHHGLERQLRTRPGERRHHAGRIVHRLPDAGGRHPPFAKPHRHRPGSRVDRRGRGRGGRLRRTVAPVGDLLDRQTRRRGAAKHPDFDRRRRFERQDRRSESHADQLFARRRILLPDPRRLVDQRLELPARAR